MWPPPLSLKDSALLKPTHEIWCRVLRVWTHRFGSPHSGQSSKHVPSKPCSLKHMHVPSCHALGTQCPHLCSALHTGDLGHALTSLGPSEPKTTLQCWCYFRHQRRPGSAVKQQAQGQSLCKVYLWTGWLFRPQRGCRLSLCHVSSYQMVPPYPHSCLWHSICVPRESCSRPSSRC